MKNSHDLYKHSVKYFVLMQIENMDSPHTIMYYNFTSTTTEKKKKMKWKNKNHFIYLYLMRWRDM